MAAPTAIAPAPPAALAPAPLASFTSPSTAHASISSALTVPATPASAAPPVLDDRLPLFTTCEAQCAKVDNRNALVFSVPTGSSLLLKLLAPPAHTYEERDMRWLHLLQAVAAVPSRKVDTFAQLATKAQQLLRSPQHKPRLERALGETLAALAKSDSKLSFSQKALLALRLKDQVARFLREWTKDPVEGFVLRKEHVVGGMRLDDLVATPVGAGYLRGYRHADRCCIVVYPWGHGFIHRRNVEKLEEAIDNERKKRRHNEYLPLEHQHLFEQVESILGSHLTDSAHVTMSATTVPDGVDLAQYQELLLELQREPYDTEVVAEDLNVLRRIQALMNKLHKRQHVSADAATGNEDENDSETSDAEHSARPQDEEPAVKRETVEKHELMGTEEQKENMEPHASDGDNGDEDEDEDDDEPMASPEDE